MSASSGEIVAVAVKALEPYDVPTGSWTEAEKREPAEAVLRAVWEQFGLDAGFHLADHFGSYQAPPEGAP